jgi:hypothetical protein
VTATPLAGWKFDEPTHSFTDANGSPIPSLTQILEGVGISDYSSVPQKRLEYKRDIGDAVHYAARYLDNGTLDFSTVQPVWANYLAAWQSFLDDTGFVAEGIEVPGVYEYMGMRFACIWDRLGRFPVFKYRALVELKCAFAEEPSWAIQLAGQELTIPKTGDEFIARIAVQLKPDGTYRVWPDLNGYQDPNDRKVFLWALATTQWKMAKGLPWRRNNL